MIWILGGVLALVSAICLVWPLLRRQDDTLGRSESAMAIFKDQLTEVDRDQARDLISPSDADAARVEIKRRMLAAGRDAAAGSTGGGAAVLIALAVLVPIAGLGLYNVTGTPGVPSEPFAERSAERSAAQQEALELAQLTDRLRTRLEADEDGGPTEGWSLLGTTYMSSGRYRDAVYAFGKLVNRDDATSATFSQYAEALITAEGGLVTPAAQTAINQAIALDPSNPAGTFYNAIATEQAGDVAAARAALLDRIATETTPAPWMEFFLAEANRMGENLGLAAATLPDFSDAFPPGPSAEDVEAAGEMSPEDRQDFIRSMVEGLAERLKEDPDDLRGWLQLAQSYVVLDEPEKALAALENAQPLAEKLPENDPLRQAVEQGLTQLSGE